MREVEPDGFFVDQLARLLHMRAEHAAQGRLQQVRGRVVAHHGPAAVRVHRRPHGLADAHGPGPDGAAVQEVLRVVFRRSGHGQHGVVRFEGAGVAHLTAAFGVKRGAVEHQHGLVPRRGGIRAPAVFQDGEHFGGSRKPVVAHELRRGHAVQQRAFARPGVRPGVFARGAGALALLAHQPAEGLLVHGQAALGDDFLREVDGEAVGVAQPERVGAGKGLRPGLDRAVHIAVQQLEALVDGLCKALFLHADQLDDHVALLGEFRIGGAVLVNHRVGHPVQERVADAEQTAVARGPAQQAAQHVAPPFVRRQDPVADQEGRAADVVGNHAQGNVLFGVFPILDARDAAHVLHDVLDGVDQEQVVHALQDAGEALKAHAGVDVRVRHRRVVALSVAVVLGEHDVPELDVAVAVAAHAAGRLSAAVSLAAVEVNLRARAAGAGAVLPEIILPPHADDALRVEADLVGPDVERLVVVLINRHPQPVHRQRQHFGAELPRPGDRLVLEIVAEREVAQHLEKRAVARSDAHAVDVRRADALLAGGHPPAGRRDLAGEVFFHRRHAGVNQQQAVVVLWNQRKARQPKMPFRLEKRQKLFAQIVQSRPFHIPFLLHSRPAPGRAKKIRLSRPYGTEKPVVPPNLRRFRRRSSPRNAGKTPRLFGAGLRAGSARRTRGNLAPEGFPLCCGAAALDAHPCLCTIRFCAAGAFIEKPGLLPV